MNASFSNNHTTVPAQHHPKPYVAKLGNQFLVPIQASSSYPVQATYNSVIFLNNIKSIITLENAIAAAKHPK